MSRRTWFEILAGILAFGIATTPLVAASYWVYFGTYTRGDSKGIYVASFDSSSGQLGTPQLAVETPNPSFLALHPDGLHLYAVSEMYGQGEKTGAVSAFRIDRSSGRLEFLNRVSSRGQGPCHLNVDRKGKFVAVANYGSGSVAVLPIREDGTLGEATGFQQHQGSSVNPKRQEGPHAHSVNFSPDNRFLIVADLGLDRLMVYRFDASTGAITPNDSPYASVKPGSGPRHFTFHPNGRYAYVINELASTVTVFRYGARTGTLNEIQTITTLPAGFQGTNYTAEVLPRPDGRFLYGSNRGHDSIAVFAIGPDGRLSPVEHVPVQGNFPRNFNLDPEGRWLIVANQNSNNVVVFRVDPQTGRLAPTGQTLKLGAPVCVKFLRRD